MKIAMSKSFVDTNKEKEWLNEQGQKGLMLIGYKHGTYEFEDVSPATFAYEVDQPDYTGAQRQDYLAFLEESGISVVAEYAGRVYLRKNAADGPLELYTDSKGIERQERKRYAHLIGIGASMITVPLFSLVHVVLNTTPDRPAFWIASITWAAIAIAGVILIVKGIGRARGRAHSQKDGRIWE